MISNKVKQVLLGNTAHMLVRKELATPAQAVATACCLVEALPKLLRGSKMFGLMIEAEYENTLVNGTEPAELDVLSTLVDAGLLVLEGSDTYTASEYMKELIDDISASRAPILASEGFLKYGGEHEHVHSVKGMHKRSKLWMDAKRIQEQSEFTVSAIMLDINDQVVEVIPQHKKLRETEWAYLGSKELVPGEAYVSEYKADDRIRSYQAYRNGPCGQASDRERALMDYTNVSTGYDITKAKAYVIAEMKDMGIWKDKPGFMVDYKSAIADPVLFIIQHLMDKNEGGHIIKPWSFVKAALIFKELRVGNRPYIGMGFGKDCKTSCAQMGGFLVSDEDLLAACGFSKEDVLDAYERVVVECNKLGIRNLTRSDVKKSFMAVLYGVSKMGLLNEKTILTPCYEKLYAGLNPVDDIDAMEVIAAKFYKAITEGFGASLNRLRNKIKMAGMYYPVKGEEGICKYYKEVKYLLPDNAQVEMDYRVTVDVNGERVFGKVCEDVTVVGAGIDMFFENMKFKTAVKDLESQSRTGFVNLVQAIDGLLARLIIVHLDRLGAQHVTSVHDCFRVNINDVELLDEAIKASYHELFGSTHNVKTPYLYKGLDITNLYFEGTHASTKPEFLPEVKNEKMFYGNSQFRRLMEIGDVDLRDCIDMLGVMKYFDK